MKNENDQKLSNSDTMKKLDKLDERFEKISTASNSLWDKAIGLEEKEALDKKRASEAN